MARDAPRWPEPGARIGAYQIVRPLGHGGMAHVHEARHVVLGKRVAIKIVHAHMTLDEVTRERFVREARAASAIRHPHVVDVFELGDHDGVPYMVMELLDGIDLAARLREAKRLPLAELVDIMLPVISAVGAAHDAGVVHRDLKPSNVFLARDRHGVVDPKVLDFGISKRTAPDEDKSLTATEMLLGSPHYMSPEQLRGARNADARSDQWSLGVTLYECATGRKPFDAESSFLLPQRILEAPIARPSALVSSLPPSFDEVVLTAMARDPARRFGSLLALGGALLPFASPSVAERWSREFASDAPALAPPGPAETTKAAVADPRDASIMAATLEDGPAGRRWRPLATWVIAAACASAVGAAFAPSFGTHATAARAPSPDARGAEIAVDAASAVTSPPAASAPGAPVPSVSSAPLASSVPEAPAPVARRPVAMKPAPPAPRGSSAPPASAAPAVSIGRNGAPIFD